MVRGSGKFYAAHGGEHERTTDQPSWLRSFANQWGKTTEAKSAVEVARERTQLPLTTEIQNSFRPSPPQRPKFNSVADAVSHYRQAVGMDGQKQAEEEEGKLKTASLTPEQIKLKTLAHLITDKKKI